MTVYRRPEGHHEFVKKQVSRLCIVSRCGHASHGVSNLLAYSLSN